MKANAIYLDGTEKEAPIVPRVTVMTERHFDKGMGELFDLENIRAEYGYYVAWAALRVAGLEKEEDYEIWLDKIKDAGIGLDEGEDEEPSPEEQTGKPTPKARSQKKSSS